MTGAASTQKTLCASDIIIMILLSMTVNGITIVSYHNSMVSQLLCWQCHSIHVEYAGLM